MKPKFVIAATAVIVITTVILLFYHHSISEKEVVRRFQAEQLRDSRQLAKEIKSYLLDRAQEVNSLSSSSSFQNHDINKIVKEIQAFIDQDGHNDFKALSVYNENGEIIYSMDKNAAGHKFKESDFFQWASIKENKGRQFFSSPTKTKSNSNIPMPEHRLLLVTPFYKNSINASRSAQVEKLSGVVTSTIDLSAVAAGLISGVSADTANQDTHIIDRNGMVVICSNHPEMVPMNINTSQKMGLTCHVLFDHVKGILIKNQGAFEYSLKEQSKKLASFSSIEVMNISWIIVSSISYDTVSGFIHKELLLTLLIIGITSFSLIVGSFLIYRSNCLQIRAEEEAKQLMEKRKLQEELIESEKHYRTVVDNSPDAIIIHCEGKIVFVNAAAVELAGASNQKDILSKPALDFVHPDERELISKRILEIFESGKTSQWIEERFLKLDGGLIYVEVVSTPIIYGGKPSLQVIIHDITEKRRSELERQIIYDITHGITTSGNIDELLKLIHQALGKVLYAENCFVALHDQETGLFSFPYFVDKYDPIPPPARLRKSCTSYVFRTNKPLFFTPELFEQLEAQGEIELVGSASPSWVGIPLQTPSRIIGVLVLQHYEEENVYTERDIKFLNTVGSQIAIAIERKNAEDELRESEEMFRRLFDESADPILLLDESGFTNCNPSTVSILKYSSKEEFLNKKPWELSPERQPDGLLSSEKAKMMIAKAIAEGYNQFEWIHTKSDGSDLPVEVMLTPIQLKGRQFLYTIWRDITARKHAEENLQNERLLLRTVIDNIPDSIYCKDIACRKILANPTELQYMGVNSEVEIIGKNDYDFYPKELAERFYADDQLVIQTGQPVLNREEYLIDEKGQKQWLLTSKLPLKDEKGNIIGVVGIGHNITNRKRAEEEIKKRNEELSKMNSEKDRFFSIIAHDLKSPFQGFIHLTEIMASDIKSFTFDELSLISKEMNSTAGNLYKLLVNLLEWAQMQKGTINFSPQDYLLSKIVKQGIETITQNAAKKGIQVVSTIKESIKVNADEKMISSVLRNLLSNAVKFTTQGGKITVDAKEIENEIVEVSVSDSGIGMSENLCKKLFKMEEKVGRKGTEGEESTGLGLLLCKEFVEKHGGKIWVQSRENIGSTFYFTLPRSNK